MRIKYYRGSQADVQAYLDAVNSNPALPVDVEGYTMQSWAIKAVECVDGLYCCPRVPQELLTRYGVTKETSAIVVGAFVNDKLTLEDYDPAWLEVEE